MKSPSNPASVPIKTPSERFIDTVTNFHSNYGVSTSSQVHRKQPRITCTNSMNDSDLSDKVNCDTSPILANFLKVYYDFVYFLLLCPFKIGTNEKGALVIKKNRLQMVLSAVMNLMCFLRLMTEIRVSLEKEYRCKSASKNPVQYFSIIMAVSSFFYKMITMKRFWFNQEDYLNVLTYVQGKSFFRGKPSSQKFFQTAFFLRIFFALVSLHTLVCFLLGKNFLSQSQSWSLSLWSTQLVKFARYTFCFDKNFNIEDTTPPSITTPMDIFFATILSIILIARNIVGIFSDLFILSNTITLWMAAKSFSTSVLGSIQKIIKRESNQWESILEEQQNNGSHHNNITTSTVDYVSHHHRDSNNGEEEEEDLVWSDVYGRFRVVQKLSMTINTALGSLLTWYMAEAVMYYSIHLNTFLTSSDIFARIDLAIFYLTTFGILFISADICSQIEHVKVWISFGENRKTIPADEFSIVLHEMLAKDVGIRGSNVFTVTYPLLAVFFSTIVTYFIICVQQGEASVSGMQVSNGTDPTQC